MISTIKTKEDAKRALGAVSALAQSPAGLPKAFSICKDLDAWIDSQQTLEERHKDNHQYMITGALIMLVSIILVLCVAGGFGLGAFL